MEDHHTITQWVGNVASVGAILTTMFGILPAAAALVAFVWYLIQIWESNTVRDWRARHRMQRIARMRAKLMILESKTLPLPEGYEDRL